MLSSATFTKRYMNCRMQVRSSDFELGLRSAKRLAVVPDAGNHKHLLVTQNVVVAVGDRLPSNSSLYRIDGLLIQRARFRRPAAIRRSITKRAEPFPASRQLKSESLRASLRCSRRPVRLIGGKEEFRRGKVEMDPAFLETSNYRAHSRIRSTESWQSSEPVSRAKRGRSLHARLFC